MKMQDLPLREDASLAARNSGSDRPSVDSVPACRTSRRVSLPKRGSMEGGLVRSTTRHRVYAEVHGHSIEIAIGIPRTAVRGLVDLRCRHAPSDSLFWNRGQVFFLEEVGP